MNSFPLGHYQVLQRLGSGGMGEVHLAEDLQLGRKVALKTLPKELQSDNESKRRLLREARAAASLDHPNVATIYEVGEADGQSFIAMQYVEGETLAHHIARAPLTIREISAISCDVLSALAAAHAKHLVHRDIKPQNIMITPEGRAIVLDFGLARLTEASAFTEVALTAAGTICGTLSYMSPEQLRAEPLDGRTDLFSFGVVLYEMITGRRPFNEASGPATIAAILFATPRGLQSLSHVFSQIVERALQKATEARYQSASEMLDSFRLGQSSAELTDRLPRSDTSIPQSRSDDGPTVRHSWPRSAPEIDPHARELYDKARVQWNKRTPQGFQLAIDHFQEAIESAPRYALAYAGLADCYYYLAFYEAIAGSDILHKARSAATKAIELDGTLAEPHTSLGYIEWSLSWDWHAGEREFVQAIELNPGYAIAPHWYSILLGTAGRFEEARAQADRAFAVDPLNPIISTALGLPWLFSRQYEEALSYFRKTEATDSRFPPVYYYLGLALEQLGEYEDAIASFERLRTLVPEGTLSVPPLAHCYAVSGDRQRAMDLLGELQTRKRRRYTSPFGLVLIYLGLGDLDSAFANLTEAFEHRSPRLYSIASDARFDSMLEDPRFDVLADRYQLPPPMRVPSHRARR